MSDTPRTDAVYPPDVIEREYEYQGDSFGWGTLKKMRDCSRQLERELNSEKAKGEKLRNCLDSTIQYMEAVSQHAEALGLTLNLWDARE